MTSKPPTPTEVLREKVRAKMGACPTCGKNRLSLRDAAAQVGSPTNATILLRFLDGKTINSDTFDRLSAWVDKP